MRLPGFRKQHWRGEHRLHSNLLQNNAFTITWTVGIVKEFYVTASITHSSQFHLTDQLKTSPCTLPDSIIDHSGFAVKAGPFPDCIWLLNCRLAMNFIYRQVNNAIVGRCLSISLFIYLITEILLGWFVVLDKVVESTTFEAVKLPIQISVQIADTMREIIVCN